MTAAELHAIYAPLWEKVPECRPNLGGSRLRFFNFMWLVGGAEGESLIPSQIHHESAAALCRAAVEDWLRESCYMIRMRRFKNSNARWENVELERRTSGTRVVETYEGPTIHHALVAAALAVVAEAKKD